MKKSIHKKGVNTRITPSSTLLMKGILYIVITLTMLACSEKDNIKNIPGTLPPALSNTPDLTIKFPPEGTIFDDSLIVVLPVINLSGTNTQINQNAIPLKYFVLDEISETLVNMHTYRIVASDGWNPYKDRGQLDLQWNNFIKGYYLPAFHRTYYHDFSQNSNYAFNVQRVQDIQLYRTIIVVKPDGNEVLFQVNTLEIVNMVNPQNNNNLEKSFQLSSLITQYITSSPQNFEYFITAADYTGGSQGSATLNWYFIQGAYYSIDIERIFFPVIEGYDGRMRLRNLIKIEMINNELVIEKQ